MSISLNCSLEPELCSIEHILYLEKVNVLEDRIYKIGRIYINNGWHMFCIKFYYSALNMIKNLRKHKNERYMNIVSHWVSLHERSSKIKPCILKDFV